MIHWIVFYTDGSSFTNLDGEPHEAPRRDALCVSQRNKDHGRTIYHGKEADFFFWEDGGWLSCHHSGLFDYLDRPGSYKVVIRGRHVHFEHFHRIYDMADKDPRLPPRSSRDAMEHDAP